MKKKIAVLLLAVVQLFLLSGCWNYVEIDEQINVSGMAFDVGREGKRLHLSVEIVTVGKGEKSQFESHVMEAEGDTVIEAIRQLMGISTKKLYFGHCKLIVIGESLARSGIRELLDLPLRNHELRTTMNIVVARGCSGRDILLTKGLTTTIVSYRICDLLTACEKFAGCAGKDKHYQVYDMLETQGLEITIPALERTQIGGEDMARLCGAGVFSGDSLVGWLTEKQAAQLSLLCGEYKMGLMTIESADSPFYSTTFEVFKAKTDTKLSRAPDGTVTAEVCVKLRVNVGEAQNKTDFLDRAQTEKNAYALEKNVEHDLNHIADLAQHSYRSDIIGIGKRLKETDPAAWKALGPDWKTNFSKVRFHIRAEVVIISSGVSNVAD